MQWYVLQTKPNAEATVKKKLANAGIEVFLPKIKFLIRTKTNQTEKYKPLFPLYLFVQLDLNPDVLHMIRYTRGVNKILGDGVNPVPIPSELVEVIRGRVDSNDILEEELKFKKGDRVRIRKGPLQDLVGVLDKTISGKGRVKVLLEIMYKIVQTDVYGSDIEKI